MSSLALLSFFTILGILALGFFIWTRRPLPITTIEKRRIDRAFHGLQLFGMEGACVSLREPRSGDWVQFKKHFQDRGSWFLEVTVGDPGPPASVGDCIVSGLAVLGDLFRVEPLPTCFGGVLTFGLQGEGLKDPNALESVARLVVRCLGHEDKARYRIQFKGPKDYDAVDRYFGFKE